MDLLLEIIVASLVCGGIAALIGQTKNLPVRGSFILGAALGIIGIIIVICEKPRLPQAPPGMLAVKCPRCNAVQNIPQQQPEYVCWQCKAAHRLRGTAPQHP